VEAPIEKTISLVLSAAVLDRLVVSVSVSRAAFPEAAFDHRTRGPRAPGCCSKSARLPCPSFSICRFAAGRRGAHVVLG